MGARSGGGGGAGMGSGSRGTTVFTGGWSGSAADTSEIEVHAINKQTEKAINVKTPVSWGDGGTHIKDIWIPKSTVGKIEAGVNGNGSLKMTMKKSMAQSISKQNSFKGYEMNWDYSWNTTGGGGAS